MRDEEDQKHGMAIFRSDILWALEPFVRYSRKVDRFHLIDGSIFVEPSADGGAIVIGCTGHAMAVFRDPKGHCSSPMTLDPPDGLFAACAPREPIAMSYCGEQYSAPLPEWAQPGDVYAYSVGIHLQPKMRAPFWSEEDEEFQPSLYSEVECGKSHYVGQDYKWTDGVKMNWRKPLATMPQATAGHEIVANPAIQALFERSVRLATETLSEIPAVHHVSSGDENSPLIIRMSGYDDFIGIYMPQRSGMPPNPQTWFVKRAGRD